jgi:hypothetical protein
MQLVRSRVRPMSREQLAEAEALLVVEGERHY